MRRFLLAVHRDGGELVARVAASIDWEPVREWVRFLAVRRGWLRPGEEAGRVVIAPRWHGTLGRPYVAAFRARLALPGRPPLTAEVPVSYLREPAVAAAAALRASGQLGVGDGYAAFAVAAEEREPPPAPAFRAETMSPPIPLLPGALPALPPRRTAAEEPAADADDVRCLVAEEVLAEAAALAAAAAPDETGGALLGQLRRDGESGELYVEVTGQVPATRAVAETARLTFTPEAWSEVRDALARREGDECLLGWWHSHPLADWSRGDGEPDRGAAAAVASLGFLSAQDRALHRTVFPRAWSVALLVTLTDDGPRLRLFGWRRGQIEPRGFERLRAAAAPHEEAPHVA